MIREACLKTTTFVALCALVGLPLLTTNAFAATATADADATIIAALAISTSIDLNFGTVAFGPGAGTCVIATNGNRSTTGSGVGVGGSPAAARFAITGEGVYTYAITLPPAAIHITNGASGDMEVDTFVSNPNSTGTLTAGADTLLVGATLHSIGDQEVGSYTGTFDVTVAYN